MAIFEFVSLTCIKPSEFDGDEVYITYGGVKVFPGEGQRFRSFRAGSRIVNDEARMDRNARDALLASKNAVPLSSIVGCEGLRRSSIPDTGLMVHVMEFDSVTSDDVLGTVLVLDQSEGGLQQRRLDGDGSHYVLSYLVQPGDGDD